MKEIDREHNHHADLQISTSSELRFAHLPGLIK